MLRLILTAALCVAAVVLVVAGRADAAPQHKPPAPEASAALPNAGPEPAAALPDAGAEPAAPHAAHADPQAPYGVRLPVITPKMRRYITTRRVLYVVGTLYYYLLLWLILRTGLSARLRRDAAQRAKPRLLQLVLYYVGFSLVLYAGSFPLDFYSGYVIEHEYGLSGQPFAGWLGDSFKGLLVGLGTTIPVLYLLYWLIVRSPRRWPLVLWAASIPIIAAAIFAQPLIIDPVFNKFTPLAAGSLRDRIHALAVQAGIPNAPILVSDVSKQTNTTNAYVNGIGSSARIVLWDTLLKGKNKMTDDQILAIVGHEMGHYVLKHIYWGFLEAVGGLFFVFPILKWAYEGLVRRKGGAWQLTGPDDFAAIPVLMLVFTVISFFGSPVVNALSRHVEHQADEYGLTVTRNPRAMAEAFVALSEQNLSDPDPPKLLTFWLGSHPPLKERIQYALSYCEKYGCGEK